MNELNPLEEAAIARALKYFEDENSTDRKETVLLETPRFRYRSLTAKVDPGWTRPCVHCYTVQYPLSGAFSTFYHKCEPRGTYVEWPPSIGRNYA